MKQKETGISCLQKASYIAEESVIKDAERYITLDLKLPKAAHVAVNLSNSVFVKVLFSYCP